MLTVSVAVDAKPGDKHSDRALLTYGSNVVCRTMVIAKVQAALRAS